MTTFSPHIYPWAVFDMPPMLELPTEAESTQPNRRQRRAAASRDRQSPQPSPVSPPAGGRGD